MTVTARPSTLSPRNSRRSLSAVSCSYAYERWVSASSSSSGSMSTPRTSRSAGASSRTVPAGEPAASGVGDPAALVLEVQRDAVRALDHAGAVREGVDDLAALDGLDQRGGLGLPLRAARVGVRAGLAALRNRHGYLSSLSLPAVKPCRAAHRASTGFGASAVMRLMPGPRSRSSQPSTHSGWKGSASTTASRTTGSRSSVSPERAWSNGSSEGYAKSSANSTWTGSDTGARQRAHSPSARVETVPEARTPSWSDSSFTSMSIRVPACTATRPSPRCSGAWRSSVRSRMSPGCRTRSRTFRTKGFRPVTERFYAGAPVRPRPVRPPRTRRLREDGVQDRDAAADLVLGDDAGRHDVDPVVLHERQQPGAEEPGLDRRHVAGGQRRSGRPVLDELERPEHPEPADLADDGVPLGQVAQRGPEHVPADAFRVLDDAL